MEQVLLFCLLILIGAIFFFIFRRNIFASANDIATFIRKYFADNEAERVTGGDETKNLKKFPRSKSEEFAIKILEEVTGEKFPTINPSWLVWRGKTLELDGYNKKLGIALEFSGPLHTKWFPEKESYIKYFDRIVKDIVKRKVCKNRGIKLIVIDCDLPQRHMRPYIISRLYDAKYIKTQPIDYILPQKATPFRNKQLEREFNLTQELKSARKAN